MIKTFDFNSAPIGTLTIKISFDIAVPHLDAINTNDCISKIVQIVHDITADEASALFIRFKVLNRDIASLTHGEWAPNKLQRLRAY